MTRSCNTGGRGGRPGGWRPGAEVGGGGPDSGSGGGGGLSGFTYDKRKKKIMLKYSDVTTAPITINPVVSVKFAACLNP